jgi:signal transduction histidine kinase
LGLAIVRQIAMRHGGSAAATRDVSGRSAFVVRFAGATAR